MILADLIKGSKTAIILPPASAILAIPAIFSTNQAEKQAKNSRIAEIAIAESEQIGILSKVPDTISAYCEQYGGHCSVKVTGKCPDDCCRTNCEYYGAVEPYQAVTTQEAMSGYAPIT